MEDKLMTPADVAQYLGVSLTTVWRWIREGKLEAKRIGRQYRISEKDLKKFVEG